MSLTKTVIFPPLWQFLCSHGNGCAGIITGVAGNAFCGVGVAHESQIAGNGSFLC